MLVADDRVVAVATPSGIRVSAPAVLRGLIEVRGVGIVRLPALEMAELALVADLVEPQAIERLPEPCSAATVCGVYLPRVLITPFEASAPQKLLLALLGTTRAGDAASR